MSDARCPADTAVCTVIDYYKPAIKSATDHCPFGMYMPGRYTSDSDTHCTTVSSTVMIPVTTRIWHPFIFTSSPVVLTGGGLLADASPGVAFLTDSTAPGDGSDGISFELDGLTPGIEQEVHIAFAHRSGSYVFAIVDTTGGQNTMLDVRQLTSSGNPDTVTFRFTPTAARLFGVGISGTTGVTSIALAGYYTYTVTLVPSTVVSTVCSEDEYRYDFNTQMKTNEWAGVGNHYTALYWEMSSTISRRLNLDPIEEIGISKYSINNNNPIAKNDPNGDCPTCIVGLIAGGISAISNYAQQATSNLLQGKTLKQSFITNIDVVDIGLSLTEGFIDGFTLGASTLGTKAAFGFARATLDYSGENGLKVAFIGGKHGKDGNSVAQDLLSETLSIGLAHTKVAESKGLGRGWDEMTDATGQKITKQAIKQKVVKVNAGQVFKFGAKNVLPTTLLYSGTGALYDAAIKNEQYGFWLFPREENTPTPAPAPAGKKGKANTPRGAQ